MYSSAYVWAKILGYLEERLTSVTVSGWFDDAEVVELNEEQLVIYSPSDFRRDFIRRRCAEHIQDGLKEIFNSDAKLVVLDEKELKDRKEKKEQGGVLEFNPQFTFDNFVVGPTNSFSYNAALAVANNPGVTYNPLFLYGPPGVGKTHLLYAIANKVRRNNPDARIVYIKGDQFINELISAIKSGNNLAFRTKYREADLFLVDDIQFIAGKDSTQDEFFHTFNALHERNKQIVMTSDRKPSDMLTLEARLRSRFESGLLSSIAAPDYETRMAIIKTKANSLGLDLADDVCNYIAINVTNNVRQIEGTVKKIMAYRDINKMPLDLPNVSRAIEDMFKAEGNALPTPSLIISQVCKFYSVDDSVIRGTQKNKAAVEARHMAVYLIRELTNLSTTTIGEELGKDHTTVLYSYNKIKDTLKSGDVTLQNHVRDITANINSCL